MRKNDARRPRVGAATGGIAAIGGGIAGVVIVIAAISVRNYKIGASLLETRRVGSMPKGSHNHANVENTRFQLSCLCVTKSCSPGRPRLGMYILYNHVDFGRW